MIKNRNLVYKLRRNLPEIQIVHDFLAQTKLKQLKKKLLPKNIVEYGENYPDKIPEIIEKCKENRSNQINRLIKFYNNYLKTWNIHFPEEEYQCRRVQMLFDCMAYGFDPDEFNYYGLFEKSYLEKRKYVTSLDRFLMQYQLSDFKALQIVFDKTETANIFKKYYKRDVITIGNKKDFSVFQNFASHHDSMVIKQVSNSSGHGVSFERIDKNNLSEQFSKILSLGRCSVEELIIQSEVLSAFNSSINTSRIMTFYTKHGVIIGPCFFRTGKAGSFVDNGGSGGIMIAIDPKTGVLNSDGYDEYPIVFTEHPDSHIIFKGFQLPDWGKCLSIVKEMSELIPKVGYVGWDMAYTADNEWVIVEANGGSHIMTQLMYNEGCKEEINAYMADMHIYVS